MTTRELLQSCGYMANLRAWSLGSVDPAGGERGAPTQLFAIAIASVFAQPSRIGWMMPTPSLTGLRLRRLCF